MIPPGTRSRTGQPLTAAELAAWQGMLQVAIPLRRELGQRLQEAHGLSMADYDVLVRLADQPDGRMRMADLADAILQPRSSLTRIADGLQRRGLITRERAPTDGRGAQAALTPNGATLFRQARRTHLDGVRRRFLDALGDDQLRQLADAWAAVQHAPSTQPSTEPVKTRSSRSDPVRAPKAPATATSQPTPPGRRPGRTA